MSALQVTVFECARCEELHHNYFSAQECCGPRTVQAWECEQCGDLHLWEDEARACHGESPVMCECGDPAKHHNTSAHGDFCLSPGCPCLTYREAPRPAAPSVPREQGVLI